MPDFLRMGLVVGMTMIGLMLAACAGSSPPRGAARPTSVADSGIFFREIRSQDGVYRYAVYVPRTIERDGPMPMIVFLHGYGESGADGQRQLAVGLGPHVLWNPEAWPFIILYPQKPSFDAEWAEYAPIIEQMMAQTRETWRIDDSRLYLTGLSMGGAGTWAINALLPETFAAIAPVCGYGARERRIPPSEMNWDDLLSSEAIEPLVDAAARVPVRAYHGRRDDVVPVTQTTRLVEAINAAGGNAEAIIYPDANHNAWDKAYGESDLAAWFLSHRRK